MILGAGDRGLDVPRARASTPRCARWGSGPWRLAVPVVAVTLARGRRAARRARRCGRRGARERAEEIQALRFGRGGDRRRFEAAREPKRWFRGKDGRRIYHLRGTLPEGGLRARDGARGLAGASGSRAASTRRGCARTAAAGVLEDVEDRTFLPDGERPARARRRRGATSSPSRPRPSRSCPGGPRRCAGTTLARADRASGGGSASRSADFQLERYNRLAYPFAGVPGALARARARAAPRTARATSRPRSSSRWACRSCSGARRASRWRWGSRAASRRGSRRGRRTSCSSSSGASRCGRRDRRLIR